MQRLLGTSVLMSIAALAGAQTPAAPPSIAPITPAPAAPEDTSSEHTGYLFGLTFGEQMHAVGITNQVTADAVARGVKDGLQGKKSTRAEQQQIQEFVQSTMAAAVAANKAAAVEFLKRNGKEKGVKTTESGLQYKVLIPGNLKAAAVLPDDEVTVNYRGKLLDGSEFDSSYARGVPATFRVNGVIKGWQEALVLMKPGAKWQLFIPPELAYDASPRPGIPGGSLLSFDVELLSVKSGTAPPLAPPGTPGMPNPPPQPQSHKQVPPLKSTPN
jgi:FKBP-type peptidyl-prolyl cis-trans isomerase